MALKTRQQIEEERKRRMALGLNSAIPPQQSNVPTMGTQGTAQLTVPPVVTPAAPFIPSQPAQFVPTAVPDISKIGAPAPVALVKTVPAQPAVAPQSGLMMVGATDPERRRRELAANDIEGIKPVMPNPIVGNGSAVPTGFMLGPEGQLIPERQLAAGLQSAQASGPDLTQRVVAAGAKPGAVVPVTNQQVMSQAARTAAAGQVTNVTPMGIRSAPLFTNANFSASAPAGVTETQQQRAKREAEQFAQSRVNTQMMQLPSYQARTMEAGNARVRQLEQDKINQGLESAAQAQAQKKMEMDVMGKVLPAQAAATGGIDQEMIKRGLDPRTGQPLVGAGAAMMPNLVENEDGVLVDQNTGKIAPPNAVKQFEAAKANKASIEKARGLAPVREHGAITTWLGAKPNVMGYNPTTGEFKEFGSADELNRKANKAWRALTPEQQKAYEEGNKGKAGNNAAPAADVVPTGLTSAGGPAQPVPGISPQQQGAVVMVFPDGKKKQVQVSELSKFLALGGKIVQ